MLMCPFCCTSLNESEVNCPKCEINVHELIENKNKYKSEEDLKILAYLYKSGLSSMYLDANFECKTHDYGRFGTEFRYTYCKEEDCHITIKYHPNHHITLLSNYYSVVTRNMETLLLIKDFDESSDYYSGYYVKLKNGKFKPVTQKEFMELKDLFNRYSDSDGNKKTLPMREELELFKRYDDYKFYDIRSKELASLSSGELKTFEDYFEENKQNIINKYREHLCTYFNNEEESHTDRYYSEPDRDPEEQGLDDLYEHIWDR